MADAQTSCGVSCVFVAGSGAGRGVVGKVLVGSASPSLVDGCAAERYVSQRTARVPVLAGWGAPARRPALASSPTQPRKTAMVARALGSRWAAMIAARSRDCSCRGGSVRASRATTTVRGHRPVRGACSGEPAHQIHHRCAPPAAGHGGQVGVAASTSACSCRRERGSRAVPTGKRVVQRGCVARHRGTLASPTKSSSRLSSSRASSRPSLAA